MTGVPTRLACLAAALAVACAAPGCQRAGDPFAEAAIERATRTQIEAARGALPAEQGGTGTEQAGRSLPLPTHFPGDIYLPRGYRVNSVMDLQDVSVLSLSAPGQVDALFADARASMQAQGWRQTLSAQHSVDAAMLAFEKDAGPGLRSTTLSFNRNHGDDRVIVGVQLRQRAP